MTGASKRATNWGTVAKHRPGAWALLATVEAGTGGVPDSQLAVRAGSAVTKSFRVLALQKVYPVAALVVACGAARWPWATAR